MHAHPRRKFLEQNGSEDWNDLSLGSKYSLSTAVPGTPQQALLPRQHRQIGQRPNKVEFVNPSCPRLVYSPTLCVSAVVYCLGNPGPSRLR